MGVRMRDRRQEALLLRAAGELLSAKRLALPLRHSAQCLKDLQLDLDS